MKKLLVVAGIAAAVFGVTKLFGRKHEEKIEEAVIPTNGYAPEPQG